MHKLLAVGLFAFLSSFTVGSAVADPPEGRGHGRGHGGREAEQASVVTVEFGDEHRRAVREYYESYGGRCPPGLAKKNNGCMPPGQAKKWAVGRPLPRDVVYYDVPRALVVRLPPIPASERYVRVAGDILLIAAGTGMVINAIEDLGRL